MTTHIAVIFVNVTCLFDASSNLANDPLMNMKTVDHTSIWRAIMDGVYWVPKIKRMILSANKVVPTPNGIPSRDMYLKYFSEAILRESLDV